jgi:hypothetical protein
VAAFLGGHFVSADAAQRRTDIFLYDRNPRNISRLMDHLAARRCGFRACANPFRCSPNSQSEKAIVVNSLRLAALNGGA